MSVPEAIEAEGDDASNQVVISASQTALAKSLVKGLRKKIGEKSDGTVSLLSDDSVTAAVEEWIPTGFPDLDRILGGGWPVGRCSEVYGQEAAGKSAITHRAIKACQEVGGVPILLDYENSLDLEKMATLGINPDALVYVQPMDIEEGWDLIWEALENIESTKPDAPTLIVWDSIAAAQPRAERLATSTSKATVGETARAMGKGCRRMFLRIPKVRAHMLFVNQERDKVGGFSGFGDNKVNPGGAAVRYAASLRVRCVKIATLKVGTSGPALGFLIRCITKKNKCAPPLRHSNWVLDFNYGPSQEMTIFQHLFDAKQFKSGGGEYKAKWSPLGFTRSDWMHRYKNDPSFRKGADEAFADLMEKYAAATGDEKPTRGEEGSEENEEAASADSA